MTVKEFIQVYENNSEYEIEVVNYIPYLQKVELCKSLIRYTTNGELIDFEIDSSLRNVMYKMMLVDAYTEIDVDFNSVTDEFDLIEEKDLMPEILSLIPQNEIVRFDQIMECLLRDLQTSLSIRRNSK